MFFCIASALFIDGLKKYLTTSCNKEMTSSQMLTYCTLVSEVFTKRKRLMVNARLRVAMMNLNVDPQATVCAV